MARPKSKTAVKRTVKKTDVKARRGRPPKSSAVTKKAGRRKVAVKRKTAVKRKATAKGPSMTVRMRELKQETRVAVKALKTEVAVLKKELSAARRSEAKLVKLFDAKDKAVAAFGAKWQAKAIKVTGKKKITRRRKRKVA